MHGHQSPTHEACARSLEAARTDGNTYVLLEAPHVPEIWPGDGKRLRVLGHELFEELIAEAGTQCEASCFPWLRGPRVAAPHTIARAAALARGTIVRHEALAFVLARWASSLVRASFLEDSAAFAAIIAAAARARRPSGAQVRTVRLSEPRMARSSSTRSRHPSQDAT